MALKKTLLDGWMKLLKMYLAMLFAGLACGLILIKLFGVSPEMVFQFSSKRIAYAATVFDAGVEMGVDQGILIFCWNAVAAVISMAFFYCYYLFNPSEKERFPHLVRKMMLGQKRMKLLCYLPGCKIIEEENLRRLYVWLMIPLLGIMLLGVESGLLLSLGVNSIQGLLWSFLSFLPHGIIEIPAFTLAGAVTYTGHLLVKNEVGEQGEKRVFLSLKEYQRSLQPVRLITVVIISLFLAAMIEAHFTTKLVEYLHG